MVCEAGEAGDEIKKYVFHEHGIDKNEVIKELGDTMWYISNICNLLGIELEEVLGRNIAKLEKRYPNGFDAIDSINRVE